MSATVTAADVRDALYKRWPAADYITIEEAPDGAARVGRKIDLLAISYWKSRGHAIDAVEIKVSTSDWKRELDNAPKADWWWEHSDRFWVAVPAMMVVKVREQLPSAWGLLSVADGVSKVVVQAPKHPAAPLPWTACIGLMRAASAAGFGALQRERAKGHAVGYEQGQKAAENTNGADALDALRAAVKSAEQAIGVPLTHLSSVDRQRFGYVSLEQIHQALGAVLADHTATLRARQALESAELQLRRAHAAVAEVIAP